MSSLVAALLVATTLALVAPAHPAKLPSYIKACKRGDPKLNECAVRNGKEAIPILVKGDAKLGIPKLDPLEIEKVVVGDSKSGKGLGITFTCNKCKISGLKGVVMEDESSIDLQKRHIELKASIPTLSVNGRYTAEGKVLILPIKGEGNANLTLGDLRLTYKTDFDLKKGKDGKDHLQLKNPKLDFKAESFNIHLTNLFNGDKTLASYIGKGCHPDDPELNLCVVRKGAPAIKKLANGDPKYRIPRLDPLVIESLRIDQGTKQVGLTLECRNCSMYGLQNINFTHAKLELEKNHCEWFFYLDELKIQGKYNVSGQVLILPITGDGDANITAKGVRFSYKYDWIFEKRANGLDYVKVTTHSLPFTVDRMYIHLDNLFNGDKLLGDNMNIFLNDNWEEIMKELSPALSEALGEVFKQTLTAMADLVPYQTLFPRD